MKKQSFDLAKMQVSQLENNELITIDGGSWWNPFSWSAESKCLAKTFAKDIVTSQSPYVAAAKIIFHGIFACPPSAG
jgi:hypothetical protein